MRRAPLLSVDSMQVYREMDIGTAKPTPAEQARIPHYMINLVEPEAEYTVALFQKTARALIESHEEIFVVGGSGLHFRSLVDPLEFPPSDPSLRRELEGLEDPVAVLVGADPEAGKVLDMRNSRRVIRALEVFHLTGQTPTERAAGRDRIGITGYRPIYPFTAIGFDPGHELRRRVEARIEAMCEAGLWDEVERLLNRLGRTARSAVGYRQLVEALECKIGPEDAWEQIRRATMQLARRQRVYFRRDPRIDWLPWDNSTSQRIDSASQALGL